MDLNDYQKRTKTTAVYPQWTEAGYPILALCGEVGELANLYKKVLRGDYTTDDPKFRGAVESEFGDILWYLARAAADLKMDLNSIAVFNLKKLALRKATGRIKTGVASSSSSSIDVPSKKR